MVFWEVIILPSERRYILTGIMIIKWATEIIFIQNIWNGILFCVVQFELSKMKWKVNYSLSILTLPWNKKC